MTGMDEFFRIANKIYTIGGISLVSIVTVILACIFVYLKKVWIKRP